MTKKDIYRTLEKIIALYGIEHLVDTLSCIYDDKIYDMEYLTKRQEITRKLSWKIGELLDFVRGLGL